MKSESEVGENQLQRSAGMYLLRSSNDNVPISLASQMSARY